MGRTAAALFVLAVVLGGCANDGPSRDPASRRARLTLARGNQVVWTPQVGRPVRLNAPLLALKDTNASAHELALSLKRRSLRDGQAVLEYTVTSRSGELPVSGSLTLKLTQSDGPEDVVLCHLELSFPQALRHDLTLKLPFEVPGPAPEQAIVPRRDGVLQTTAFPLVGSFLLGQAASGGTSLGLPVIGCAWEKESGVQLAISADPYCGSEIEGRTISSGTFLSINTRYPGLIVPVRSERRTFALEFHRSGADGTLRSFYRTIPEIQPGPDWIHGVHLVYYDYLSEKGQGWFKDLQTLADRIPAARRGNVALCLHGWYDYFQQYAYDHARKQLLPEWVAFPGTFKVPLSLGEMHRRLKFAKDLGFRVLLYFSDGTNSDGGAPNFRETYVLKDKEGKSFPGWKGPDSLGQPWMMDPSVPALREWYRGYMHALLEEYARAVDGFVWDETFYIPVDFVSCGPAGPACADRAMMSLVSELAQMVQSYRGLNPDLVLLAADNGTTSYALVAHGTYQDSGARERHWGASLLANYRNCLWSCNWTPIQNDEDNRIAAEKYGLPQGVSNGWGDNCGPNRMPPELLDRVLERFVKNVESGRRRARWLEPAKP